MTKKPAGTPRTVPSLCDVNFWLALSLAAHAHHASAVRWFEQVDEEASLLFCRATQQSFLRLLTTPSILTPYAEEARTDVEAWAAYDALLADYRIVHRQEPGATEVEWRRVSQTGQVSPKRWMDAYLAGYCIAGGFRFVTFDAAFRSFSGLDVVVLR